MHLNGLAVNKSLTRKRYLDVRRAEDMPTPRRACYLWRVKTYRAPIVDLHGSDALQGQSSDLATEGGKYWVNGVRDSDTPLHISCEVRGTLSVGTLSTVPRNSDQRPRSPNGQHTSRKRPPY